MTVHGYNNIEACYGERVKSVQWNAPNQKVDLESYIVVQHAVLHDHTLMPFPAKLFTLEYPSKKGFLSNLTNIRNLFFKK